MRFTFLLAGGLYLVCSCFGAEAFHAGVINPRHADHRHQLELPDLRRSRMYKRSPMPMPPKKKGRGLSRAEETIRTKKLAAKEKEKEKEKSKDVAFKTDTFESKGEKEISSGSETSEHQERQPDQRKDLKPDATVAVGLNAKKNRARKERDKAKNAAMQSGSGDRHDAFVWFDSKVRRGANPDILPYYTNPTGSSDSSSREQKSSLVDAENEDQYRPQSEFARSIASETKKADEFWILLDHCRTTKAPFRALADHWLKAEFNADYLRSLAAMVEFQRIEDTKVKDGYIIDVEEMEDQIRNEIEIMMATSSMHQWLALRSISNIDEKVQAIVSQAFGGLSPLSKRTASLKDLSKARSHHTATLKLIAGQQVDVNRHFTVEIPEICNREADLQKRRQCYRLRIRTGVRMQLPGLEQTVLSKLAPNGIADKATIPLEMYLDALSALHGPDNVLNSLPSTKKGTLQAASSKTRTAATAPQDSLKSQVPTISFNTNILAIESKESKSESGETKDLTKILPDTSLSDIDMNEEWSNSDDISDLYLTAAESQELIMKNYRPDLAQPDQKAFDTVINVQAALDSSRYLYNLFKIQSILHAIRLYRTNVIIKKFAKVTQERLPGSTLDPARLEDLLLQTVQAKDAFFLLSRRMEIYSLLIKIGGIRLKVIKAKTGGKKSTKADTKRMQSLEGDLKAQNNANRLVAQQLKIMSTKCQLQPQDAQKGCRLKMSTDFLKKAMPRIESDMDHILTDKLAKSKSKSTVSAIDSLADAQSASSTPIVDISSNLAQFAPPASPTHTSDSEDLLALTPDSTPSFRVDIIDDERAASPDLSPIDSPSDSALDFSPPSSPPLSPILSSSESPDLSPSVSPNLSPILSRIDSPNFSSDPSLGASPKLSPLDRPAGLTSSSPTASSVPQYIGPPVPNILRSSPLRPSALSFTPKEESKWNEPTPARFDKTRVVVPKRASREYHPWHRKVHVDKYITNEYANPLMEDAEKYQADLLGRINALSSDGRAHITLNHELASRAAQISSYYMAYSAVQNYRLTIELSDWTKEDRSRGAAGLSELDPSTRIGLRIQQMRARETFVIAKRERALSSSLAKLWVARKKDLRLGGSPNALESTKARHLQRMAGYANEYYAAVRANEEVIQYIESTIPSTCAESALGARCYIEMSRNYILGIEPSLDDEMTQVLSTKLALME